MRSIFTDRGIVLIGMILVSAAGIAPYIPELTKTIGDAHPEVYLKQLFDFINSIPPNLVNLIFNTINFNATVISSAGTIELNTATVLGLVALVILSITFFLLQRAIKSTAFFDDFVALGVFYIALRVVVGIWIRVQILPQPLGAGFTASLMTLIVIYLLAHSGASVDSKILFRGLLQIYLIWVFVFPSETIRSTLGALDGFASFCSKFMPTPTPLFISLSAIGLVVALGQIYKIGVKPKPPTGTVLDGLQQQIDGAFDRAKKNT